MAGISPGLLGGALAAGLAAAVGGYVAFGALRTPEPEAPEPPATAPAPVAAAPAPEPAGVEAPAAEAAAAPPAAPPTFDVVRVEPDGAAVVAGRAEPGAQVTISNQAGPLAEATADASGEFVAVFDAPPADAPQALSLEAEDAAGVTTASPDVVVLLPAAPEVAPEREAAPDATAQVAASRAPEPSPPATAPAEKPQASPPNDAPAQVAAAPAAPDPAADDPPAAQPEPEVAATVVLRGEEAEATPTAPAGSGRLTLASISYGETGVVTLAGFGAAGSPLRAYIDDRFALDGAVGADGRWTLDLSDVAAGIYRLRIDALRPDGAVVARVETPFQRDFPALAAPETGGARPAAITVQPGNNLWMLAREHYGAGVLYTQIHTANRDLIRDPELIYPGQIFVLPEAAPAE